MGRPGRWCDRHPERTEIWRERAALPLIPERELAWRLGDVFHAPWFAESHRLLLEVELLLERLDQRNASYGNSPPTGVDPEYVLAAQPVNAYGGETRIKPGLNPHLWGET